MEYGVLQELKKIKKREEELRSGTKETKQTTVTAPKGMEPGAYRELQKIQEKEEDIRSALTTKSTRGGAGGSLIADDDIGPTAEWFQKGAMEDGVTGKNAWRAARGTGVDIAEDLTIGAVGAAERIWDGMVALGPVATEAMWNANGGYYNLRASKIVQQGIDQAKAGMPEYIAQNLIDEEAIARKIITDPAKEKWGVDTEKDSVLGTKVDSYVQTAGDILARGALGPAGNAASFLSVAGGEAENAFKEGASYEQAVLSGMLSGTAEMGSEALFGGIKFGGKTLTDSVAQKIGSSVPNKVLATLAKWGFNTAGEGAEEVISDGLTAIGQKLTYMNEEELNELFSKEDAWESFLGGMVVGGFFEGVNIAGAKLKGMDYATGMSNNEKKVVDLEYQNRLADAEKSGKLSQQEKSKIYDRVLSDMERGIISTETIEAALGGDTYKSYQETVKGEEDLQKEFDTLNKMKQGDMTGEQIDRRTELKTQLEGIKNTSKRSDLQKQLSQEVMGRIKADRLMESYRERDRRSQAFEADLQQYNEKQRTVIQRAIDSGILNNTNLTHDFVDMVAKVSADKGVAFDFINNEKLKQSGFALEGKTVNGYVSKDSIAVNIQSAKALNTVVGHEIAHVLEDTDLYQPMQEMLIGYSKAKGDYQNRVDSLTKLYEGIEGADINKELTADLIGDYLFTDKDFIQRLSTENRSAFQKIYDEIKYLCRVATAGSKQARELEKIKKTFAEVYRADAKNPTAVGGVKYDLSQQTAQADITSRYQAAADQVLNMQNTKQDHLVIGYTPSAYSSLGMPSLPFVIGTGHVYSVAKTEAEAKQDGNYRKGIHYHGLGANVIKNIYDALKDPIMIIASKDVNRNASPMRSTHSVVAIVDVGNSQKSLLLPVEITAERSVNGVRMDVNALSSVYDKKVENLVNEAIAMENTGEVGIYYAKKEALTLPGAGVQFPVQLQQSIASNGIIHSFSEKVNMNISDATQSQQFKRWFGDWQNHPQNASKVVNDDGTPKVVYHGTNAKFNTFYSKSGEYWFSEFEDYAESMMEERGGGEVKAVYLNMRNPYREKLAPGQFTDPTYEAPIIRKAKAEGYDGVIIENDTTDPLAAETFYVVFNPEQIKSATDNIGTFDGNNPDIRYSVTTEGTTGQAYGSYNVYGEDVALETQLTGEKSTENQGNSTDDLGPVREDLKKAPADPTVIDMRLERDKAALEAAYQAKREKMEAEVADKDAYIKKKAKALYDEISVLKKGIKASDQLSYLLDEEPDWSRIKSALINIQHTPDRQVNIHSQIEEAARKMLDLDYEDRLMDINDLEAELAVNMTNLDAEAAMEKAGEGGENAGIRKSVSDKIVKQIIAAQTELDNNRRFRQQAIDDYDTQIAETQAELEGKKNQDSKVAQTLRQRIERLSRMKTDIVADYDARIEKLEARVEKLNSKEYSRAEYRRAKQEEYSNMWEDMLGDTSKWKDMKIGLQYKTKTLRRILRRVVRDSEGKTDFAKADRIYDELETKYDHHEAELKRESQRLKEVFFELDMNHAEDTYAHMMGELLYNPQTKLSQETVDEYYKKHKSRIDTEKVDKAIKESRKVFDELIGRMNERLREQGLQEIPYRQGYFPHFTNPKQNFIQKAFNWRPVDTEIPTSIAGLTEAFKPQRSWQSFNKQRQSDTTDYSLYQGLDTYIHGALDWIYHIEDLQKRRALENYLRYIHSEEHIKQKIDEIKASDMDADEAQRQINAVLDEAKNPLGGLVRELMNRTNTLANKKSVMDRVAEDSTNRKIYSTMTNLNNRINANMVVGSISSALTNFIPMVQSWHQVSPYFTVRGLSDFVRSTVVDDGTIAKSDFLTNRLVEEEKLYQTGWDKVSDKAAFMMNVIDNITSQTVWRSKYLQNLDEGMGEAAAIKDADQFAKNLMAGRSRGNAPSIFDAKNPIIKLFTAFQLEVANQYGYMFEDVPQDTMGKYKPSQAAIRLTKGYAAAYLGAYVYNALYSSLVGRDAAFDPIGIMEDLLSGLFDEEEEEEPLDVMLEFGGNVLDELPYISGLTGGGRIPISSALPYSGDQTPFVSMLTDVTEGNWKSFGKEFLKPLYYLGLPVAGGQVKKTVEGLSMFADDLPIAGSYTDSGKLRFPVADTFGNRAKAALFGQYSSKNARDYFENERSALSSDQVREFMASGMSIKDYWDYRDGLKEHDTLAEKANYIAGLDLPANTKNLLVNNVAGREEAIDLTDYDKYGDFEEMDFAIHNPEKYEQVLAFGGYDKYKPYAKAMSGMDLDEKADYIAGLDLPTEQKNILINLEANREESIDLTGYDQYGDLEEMDFAIKNPEKYQVALAVGGYDKYKVYKEGMKDMDLGEKADYIAGLNLTTAQKNALINSESTREEPIDLTGYENYSSFEEFEYAKSNPDGYALAKSVGGYEAYTAYSQALGDIKADKDEFGKSISGSRKKKVQDYLNGLDADYSTKLMLYKSQYTSYDDENYEIVEYVNSLKDLTFVEKVAVLRELGFKVDEQGNIYW